MSERKKIEELNKERVREKRYRQTTKHQMAVGKLTKGSPNQFYFPLQLVSPWNSNNHTRECISKNKVVSVQLNRGKLKKCSMQLKLSSKAGTLFKEIQSLVASCT